MSSLIKFAKIYDSIWQDREDHEDRGGGARTGYLSIAGNSNDIVRV